MHLIQSLNQDDLMKKSLEILNNPAYTKKSNIDSKILIPFLAPNDYREEIVKRESKVKQIKMVIEKLMAGSPGEPPLTEDQRRMVLNAIQGYFKEWVKSREDWKNISDIVKWIDREK